MTFLYIHTFQIIAKEVILHDIDISNAIVNYITNNYYIANLVVGASARNSFIKSLSSSLFHAWYHLNFGYTKC